MVFKMKNSSEIRTIEKTVNLYIEGLYERKFNLLKEAFWDKARNVGITPQNEFWFKTMDFWEEKCKSPPDQEFMKKAEIIIESIDVWHNSAMAKVKLVVTHKERIYECMDYLSILKIDSKWKIINKTWSSRNILKE